MKFILTPLSYFSKVKYDEMSIERFLVFTEKIVYLTWKVYVFREYLV